jgi:hypothetical protein
MHATQPQLARCVMFATIKCSNGFNTIIELGHDIETKKRRHFGICWLKLTPQKQRAHAMDLVCKTHIKLFKF